MHDYHVKKFIESLPSLGWFDGQYAYLIVYNKHCPSKSYILKERL